MPTAPARTCKKHNCRGLVRDGVCSVCGPVRTTGWKDRNGSRQSRGYDNAWLKLRAALIEQRRIEQGGAVLCQDCQTPISGKIHADHKEAFSGIGDPKRLDPDNIVLLCEGCHMRKTVRASNA